MHKQIRKEAREHKQSRGQERVQIMRDQYDTRNQLLFISKLLTYQNLSYTHNMRVLREVGLSADSHSIGPSEL